MKGELKSKLCKREKKKRRGGGNNGKASQVVFEKRVFQSLETTLSTVTETSATSYAMYVVC